MKKLLRQPRWLKNRFVWFTNEHGYTEFSFAGEGECTHRYYPAGMYPRDNGGELYRAACELAETLGIAKTEDI